MKFVGMMPLVWCRWCEVIGVKAVGAKSVVVFPCVCVCVCVRGLWCENENPPSRLWWEQKGQIRNLILNIKRDACENSEH